MQKGLKRKVLLLLLVIPLTVYFLFDSPDYLKSSSWTNIFSLSAAQTDVIIFFSQLCIFLNILVGRTNGCADGRAAERRHYNNGYMRLFPVLLPSYTHMILFTVDTAIKANTHTYLYNSLQLSSIRYWIYWTVAHIKRTTVQDLRLYSNRLSYRIPRSLLKKKNYLLSLT